MILKNLLQFLAPGKSPTGNTEQGKQSLNIGADLLEWPERSIKAVDMARKRLAMPTLRIADYGCGKQTARGLLPPGWEYVPFDYCSRSPDTVLCDFNTSLPEGAFDLILCLGVLEYLEDPFRLLRHALQQGGWVVFSYNGPTTEERRSVQGWKNCLSFGEIESFLQRRGCAVIETADLGKNEWIYLVRSGATS